MRTGPSNNAAPGWISRKMRYCDPTSTRMAIATRSRMDASIFRNNLGRWTPCKTTARIKGGSPARASLTPPRAPSMIATVGCRTNRILPGPERRANRSAKKSWVNRYGLPVCMILQTALGNAARSTAMTTTVKTELARDRSHLAAKSPSITGQMRPLSSAEKALHESAAAYPVRELTKLLCILGRREQTLFFVRDLIGG